MAGVKRVTPYGLKEVADVYFFPVGTTISVDTTATSASKLLDVVTASSDPSFIFDTLKVSNIEVSSEDNSANGGKGNPELINWSYGK